MKNSIIIQAFLKALKGLKVFYNYSITRKVINDIVDKVELCFKNSIILKSVFARKERSDIIKNSIIFRGFSALIHKLVSLFHGLFQRGVAGSYGFKWCRDIIHLTKNHSFLNNSRATFRNSFFIKGLEKIFIFEPEE